MRALKAWRIINQDRDQISIEETNQPDMVAIVLDRQNDLRRIWLRRDEWDALMACRYEICWQPDKDDAA